MQTASRVYQQMTKWPQRTGEPKPVRGTEPCWLQRPFCPISLKLQQYNSAQGNVPPEPFQLVPDPNLYAASGPCKSPGEQQCTIFSHPRTSVPPTDVSHAFSSIPSTRCDTCGSHSMYVCKVSEQMNEQTNRQRENGASAHPPRSERCCLTQIQSVFIWENSNN